MLDADDADALRRPRAAAGATAAAARSCAATAKVGGGALPLLELEGPVVALAGERDALAAPLRAGDPPVVGRIADGRLLLDPRTLTDEEADAAARRRRAPRADDERAPLTLGTAGHIDHGKTALVARADRRRHRPAARGEGARHLDRARLRAAARCRPGAALSVVDVPGHERFVRTMVAGATGIDLFLMVVAADDGVMPQTREHAAVLARARRRATGVVAVTKADLADPARAPREAAELLPRRRGRRRARRAPAPALDDAARRARRRRPAAFPAARRERRRRRGCTSTAPSPSAAPAPS